MAYSIWIVICHMIIKVLLRTFMQYKNMILTVKTSTHNTNGILIIYIFVKYNKVYYIFFS